jgi:hypothetical protein
MAASLQPSIGEDLLGIRIPESGNGNAGGIAVIMGEFADLPTSRLLSTTGHLGIL